MKLKAIAGILALVSSVSAYSAVAPAQTFTDSQKNEIEEVTKNYLLSHPEILIKMSQELQAKQAESQQASMTANVFKLKKQLMQTDGIPYVGPKDAKVTVTEFFDYQCIFCSRMSPIVEQLVKDNPQVKFIFRDWPIFASHWPESNTAAQTGLAVFKEAGSSAYLQYHNGIYATGHAEGKLTADDISKTAAASIKLPLKLDSAKEYTTTIDKNSMLAEAIGAGGTPLFVIMPADPKDPGSITVIPGASSLDQLQDAVTQAKK